MLLSTYARINPMSIEFISDRQTPWLSILQTAVTVNVTVQTFSPTGSLIMISQPYSYRYKPVQTKKKIACDKTFLDLEPDERRTLKDTFQGSLSSSRILGPTSWTAPFWMSWKRALQQRAERHSADTRPEPSSTAWSTTFQEVVNNF